MFIAEGALFSFLLLAGAVPAALFLSWRWVVVWFAGPLFCFALFEAAFDRPFDRAMILGYLAAIAIFLSMRRGLLSKPTRHPKGSQPD
jgi:hypothetical protein